MRKKKWCKPRIPPDSSITITFIVHYRGCCPSAHNCQNCYTTESRILTISLSHNLTISHFTISLTTELPPNWHRERGGGPLGLLFSHRGSKKTQGFQFERATISEQLPNLKTPHALVLRGGGYSKGTIENTVP